VGYTARVHGEHFTFSSLKDVLARANELRSGDRQAGLAARSMRELAAAKRVLADVTLKALRESPSVPYERDEVTRVVEDGLDARAYAKVSTWTVAQLREWILDHRTTGEEIAAVPRGSRRRWWPRWPS
jgi:ethanolamine ammonia-lyase large subunit